MGSMRDGPVCRFAARAFVLLEGGAGLVVVDRVELTQFGRPETRLHSRAQVRLAGAGARLRGQRQRLSLACAADVPARLWHGVTTPTTPQPGAQVLRWCPDDLHEKVTLATLLIPGGASARAAVTGDRDRITVESTAAGRSLPTLRLTTRLRPA